MIFLETEELALEIARRGVVEIYSLGVANRDAAAESHRICAQRAFLHCHRPQEPDGDSQLGNGVLTQVVQTLCCKVPLGFEDEKSRLFLISYASVLVRGRFLTL